MSITKAYKKQTREEASNKNVVDTKGNSNKRRRNASSSVSENKLENMKKTRSNRSRRGEEKIISDKINNQSHHSPSTLPTPPTNPITNIPHHKHSITPQHRNCLAKAAFNCNIPKHSPKTHNEIQLNPPLYTKQVIHNPNTCPTERHQDPTTEAIEAKEEKNTETLRKGKAGKDTDDTEDIEYSSCTIDTNNNNILQIIRNSPFPPFNVLSPIQTQTYDTKNKAYETESERSTKPSIAKPPNIKEDIFITGPTHTPNVKAHKILNSEKEKESRNIRMQEERRKEEERIKLKKIESAREIQRLNEEFKKNNMIPNNYPTTRERLDEITLQIRDSIYSPKTRRNKASQRWEHYTQQLGNQLNNNNNINLVVTRTGTQQMGNQINHNNNNNPVIRTLTQTPTYKEETTETQHTHNSNTKTTKNIAYHHQKQQHPTKHHHIHQPKSTQGDECSSGLSVAKRVNSRNKWDLARKKKKEKHQTESTNHKAPTQTHKQVANYKNATNKDTKEIQRELFPLFYLNQNKHQLNHRDTDIDNDKSTTNTIHKQSEVEQEIRLLQKKPITKQANQIINHNTTTNNSEVTKQQNQLNIKTQAKKQQTSSTSNAKTNSKRVNYTIDDSSSVLGHMSNKKNNRRAQRRQPLKNKRIQTSITQHGRHEAPNLQKGISPPDS